jgi:mannose/fructose-specific phosphotransferase system component IIA
MSDAKPGVRGVVVAHGEMADGLVSAVRRIVGDAADSLHALSNDGKSPAVLREELDELAGDEPVVVFVDLATGSCGIAALSCCRDRARRVLVGGVNLPMLLDFVFSRSLPLEELVPRLIDRGRAAIGRPLQGS